MLLLYVVNSGPQCSPGKVPTLVVELWTIKHVLLLCMKAEELLMVIMFTSLLLLFSMLGCRYFLHARDEVVYQYVCRENDRRYRVSHDQQPY